MTDQPIDPRFDRALRDTLAELEPGEVPAALRAAVRTVPARSERRRPAWRGLVALGGVAAAVLVAVLIAGVMAGFVTSPQTGVRPSIGASHLPAGIHLELVPDDVMAETAGVIRVLETRLAAAGYGDARVALAEGRILVDVATDPADTESIVRLISARGQVEALETGLDDIQPGTPVDDAAYSTIFRSDDVVSADLLEVFAEPAGVLFQLDGDATDRLSTYTGAHVGEMFTIAVDGVAVVVPMVQAAITDGALQVRLADGDGGAPMLLAYLRSGPLPTPLRMVDGNPGPSFAPQPTLLPSEPTAGYLCTRFPFQVGILQEGRRDEAAATPEAAALRDHLATDGPDYDWLPDEGWALAGRDDDRAEFVTIREDGGVAWVDLLRDDDWRVTGWGQCRLRVVLADGLREATWELAPGQSVGPATTEVDVLVREVDCASGLPADDRIVGPTIASVGSTVVVTFAVRPPEGSAFTCQANPTTRVTVTLPEPLGDRQLLDGSSMARADERP